MKLGFRQAHHLVAEGQKFDTEPCSLVAVSGTLHPLIWEVLAGLLA